MSDYIDASYGFSNPSKDAFYSVRQVNQKDLQTNVLVSIGTGQQLEGEPPFGSGYRLHKEYFNKAAILDNDIKSIHLQMLDTTLNYFRLNVEHLGMAFDEWKGKKGDETLQLIRTKTERYLQSPDVKKDIAEIARQLVAVRRQRSTWKPDLDRWERFCNGMEYACPVSTCKDDAKRYKARQSLRNHLTEIHSIEPDKLEPLLDAGKRSLFDQFRE